MKRPTTKISFKKRIAIAFLSLVLVGGGIWFISDYTNYLVTQKLHIIISKNRLMNTILEARRYEKNYFLTLHVKNLAEALGYAKTSHNYLDQIIVQYGRYVATKDLDVTVRNLQEYEELLEEVALYHKEHFSPAAGESFSAGIREYQKTVRNLANKITQDIEFMVTRESQDINKIITEARVFLFVGTIGAFIICITVAGFLVYQVNRPLDRISRAVRKITKGDYTNIPQLGSGDEFDALVDSLNHMIYEINRRNEQLIQSEKMASLGTLTSGVAHELNNPLNNISTSIQIVLEELEEGNIDQQKELLTEAEQQTERARDIVKSLLEFSRQHTFRTEPVDMKTLVSQTIKLVKSEMPSNVEVVVNVPDNMEALIDFQRIEQVLINLIFNAVQAMEGGGVLKISAFRVRESGEMCLQVQDTGHGIPREDIHKIFNPFFSSKEKGSGLGLSVSHGIIEQHGGRIEVQSTVGEGSTFSLYLPLA